MFEQNIDLKLLVNVGPIQLSIFNSLPINTIFLGSANGYYVTEQFFNLAQFGGLILSGKLNREKYINNSSDMDEKEQEDIDSLVQNTEHTLMNLQVDIEKTLETMTSSREEAELNVANSQLEQVYIDLC